MATEEDLAAIVADAAHLWNAHKFFECHDKLEEAWRPLKKEKKAERPSDARRDFIHAIILYAAAYVHWQRGNALGVERKLADARRVQGVHVPDVAWGVDLPAFRARVEADLERAATGAAFDALRVPRLSANEVGPKPA